MIKFESEYIDLELVQQAVALITWESEIIK
jgi:hypothetical protein